MKWCYPIAQSPNPPKPTITGQTHRPCSHLQGPFQGHSRQAIPSDHHRRLVSSSLDQETRTTLTSQPHVHHNKIKPGPNMVLWGKAAHLAAAAVHTRHPHRHQAEMRYQWKMWDSSLLVQ